MPDVFISYSRRDSDFVRKLHEALRERGKEVWVDWEDIPPAARWRDELREALEDSDAFVFVISPDSATSKYCREEIDRAAELHKRIVPLVHRRVPDDGLPETMTTRNWIFFDVEPFEDGLDKLIRAVETDLDWVRGHTRWLEHATEWERNKRDRSFLLRGTELTEAEQWVTQGSIQQRSPPPSPLHHEYVAASRQAASKRQRLTVSAVSLALVVAIGLAVAALVARNAADEQRRVATSRELAANSLLNLERSPELSLLLGLEAAKAKPTRQAEDALRQALAVSPSRLSLPASRRGLRSASYSSDGSLVLTVRSPDAPRTEAAATLWSAATGRRIAELKPDLGRGLVGAEFDQTGRQVLTAGEGFPGNASIDVWDARTGAHRRAIDVPVSGYLDEAAFSPDGKLIAAAEFSGPTRIYESSSGRHVQSLDTELPSELAFSPDGRSLVTVGQGDPPTVWSVETGKRRMKFRGRDSERSDGEAPDFAAEFSLDGRRLLTAGDGTTRVWNAKSGRHLAVLRGASGGRFSPDGTRVLSAGPGDVARVWDATTGRRLAQLRGHNDEVITGAFSRDGKYVVTGSSDQTARVWNASGETVDELRGHGGGVVDAMFSPDGHEVLTAGSDGAATVWQPRTGRPTSTRPGVVPPSEEPLAVSPPPTRLIATQPPMVEESGEVFIREAGTGRRRALIVADAYVSAAAFSGDARTLAARDDEDTVQLWTVANGELRDSLPSEGLTDALPGAIAVNTDGTRIALGNSVWDSRARRRMDLREAPVRLEDLRFSPDGRLLVGSTWEGKGGVWDVQTGRKVSALPGSPPPLRQPGPSYAAFAPDGRRIISTWNWDDTARISDVRSGRVLAELVGHAGGLETATFSPDGRLAATLSEDDSARIWDIGTERTLLVLRSSGALGLRAISFAPDASSVLVHGNNGSVEVFNCHVCGSIDRLASLARQRVTRKLTREERIRYLHEP